MKVLQEYYMEQETVNDDGMVVIKRYFQNGDRVNAGDTVIDVETSKAVVEIDTDQAGIIEYGCKEGDTIRTGTLLFTIFDPAAAEPVAQPADETPDTGRQTSANSVGKPLFSRRALALLEKHGLKEKRFQGRDFVTREDVEGLIHPPVPEPPAGSAIPTIADGSLQAKRPEMPDGMSVTVEPVSSLKKTEISYLSMVQAAGLNSTIHVHVDVENVFRVTRKYFEVFKDSILPLVIYEASRLLKQYRPLNAYYEDGHILYYDEVHIGLAVDIEEGLKVLTIPHPDRMAPGEIETTINDLVNRYLDRRLKPEHTSGSTFTISDLSSQQVSFFQPLINRNQSAILGISGLDPKMGRCVLTLVFDHRVTEGMLASRFLVQLKERIESYSLAKDKAGDTPLPTSVSPDPLPHEAAAGTGDGTFLRCHSCLKTPAEDRLLSGPGLIKVVNAGGEERVICRDCMMGF